MKRSLLLGLFLIAGPFLISASHRGQEEPPEREQTITEAYTEYLWLMVAFDDNQTKCEIPVDHAGLPAANEVFYNCEQRYYERWVKTPPCEPKPSSGSTSHCLGVYLHLDHQDPRTREVTIRLPDPYVEIELQGCTFLDDGYQCSDLPYLLLRAYEPIKGEQITAVKGTYEGEGFECPGDACLLPLRPSTLEGTELEFWAESSYGDQSPIFTARVRVTYGQRGDAWTAHVLSSRWRGEVQSVCAQSWEVFPPAHPPVGWMETPDDPAVLGTSEPYAYLAGRLIDWGLADVSECPGSGLLGNGYADACGLRLARQEVDQWQNQFDEEILRVAEEKKVPAKLLKYLFAHETQFWPGYHEPFVEYGLGQFTALGTDFLLFWNADYYSKLCPEVLRADVCRAGYPHLDEDHQEMLRVEVLRRVNMECQDCTIEYMIDRAEESVSTFADALVASCNQTGQTVYNATFSQPMEVADFRDMWYFTLANYNSGANCLYDAVRDTLRWREPIDWAHVSERLPEGCESAVEYVESVTRER